MSNGIRDRLTNHKTKDTDHELIISGMLHIMDKSEERKHAIHGLSNMIIEIKEDVEPVIVDYEKRMKTGINLRHVCLEVFIIVSSAAIIGYAGYLLRGVI